MRVQKDGYTEGRAHGEQAVGCGELTERRGDGAGVREGNDAEHVVCEKERETHSHRIKRWGFGSQILVRTSGRAGGAIRSSVQDHVDQPFFRPSCSARRWTSRAGSAGANAAVGMTSVFGADFAGSGALRWAHCTETLVEELACRL